MAGTDEYIEEPRTAWELSTNRSIETNYRENTYSEEDSKLIKWFKRNWFIILSVIMIIAIIIGLVLGLG